MSSNRWCSRKVDTIIVALVALALTAAPSSASAQAEQPAGLDRPEVTRRQQVDVSHTAEGEPPITQTCFVFPTAAIVEINDPGLQGTQISIRKREIVRSIDALCADRYKGVSISIPDTDSHFVGVAGEFLIVSAADAFGAALGFRIYNLSGVKIFEGIRNATKPFTVTKAKGDVCLRYWAQLQRLPCWPEEAGCWPRILSANGVEARLSSSKQPCAVPLDQRKGEPSQLIQIFGPADLSLAHPKLRFLDGEATCGITP